MNDIFDVLDEYFSNLDISLEKLSDKKEGKIARLPSWTLVNRDITIAFTPDIKGVVIRVEPNVKLDEDQYNKLILNKKQDLLKLFSPITPEFGIKKLGYMPFNLVGDPTMVNKNNPLAPPALESECLIGYGNINSAFNVLSIEDAKKDALDFWNKALYNIDSDSNKSYILETGNILRKLKRIVNRNSFLERKIHRYIDDHRKILLPEYSRCFYEHELFLNDEKRIADFILEREIGMPPILIELENPTHNVFKRDGELTAEANHAKNQIADWVRLIDSDAKCNASGKFSFLAGPKERLVIIGRGLEHKSKLINTKFSDTKIWTYDLFIEQARKRLNNNYIAQCDIVGMEEIEPF